MSKEELNTEVITSRSIEDIDNILKLAKLNPEEFLPNTQILHFASEDLCENKYKLLELNDHLINAINCGDTIVIKGEQNENAVICTKTRTYDLLDAETSNSLLLVEGLKFKDQMEIQERSTSGVKVSGIFYNYLEMAAGKLNMQKLKKLLGTVPYKGPEFEDTVDKRDLYTYNDLQNIIQGSKQELDAALKEMHVINIDGHVRLLDFEYHFRVLSYMLNLIDENSWQLDNIDYEETMNLLSDIIPSSILESIFDLYTEKSKIIDCLQLYRYKEIDVCRFFAQVLLCNAGKFNLSEFIQAWEESVPEGMVPSLEMLNGMVIIDQNCMPNTIRLFSEDKLPEKIIDRFKVLFDAKEKWTALEIAPYIQRLTTETADVNTLLAKYARTSTVNGVKLYSSKHKK